MTPNIIIPKYSGHSRLWLPASARTSLNDPRFRPWRATLMVQLNDKGDLEKAVYYVRAGDPQKSCMVAERWWQMWEKSDIGLHGRAWPDVVNHGFAECIDENDWNNAWDAARKYQMQFRAVEDENEPGFPMGFTIIGRTDV
jgi:hypothetical protein